MSSAAAEKNRVSGLQTGLDSSRASNGSVATMGTVLREGHELAQAAIADGELVDARPLGPSLAAVLAAMLGSGALPASNGEGGGFKFPILQTFGKKKLNPSIRTAPKCIRSIF